MIRLLGVVVVDIFSAEDESGDVFGEENKKPWRSVGDTPRQMWIVPGHRPR